MTAGKQVRVLIIASCLSLGIAWLGCGSGGTGMTGGSYLGGSSGGGGGGGSGGSGGTGGIGGVGGTGGSSSTPTPIATAVPTPTPVTGNLTMKDLEGTWTIQVSSSLTIQFTGVYNAATNMVFFQNLLFIPANYTTPIDYGGHFNSATQMIDLSISWANGDYIDLKPGPVTPAFIWTGLADYNVLNVTTMQKDTGTNVPYTGTKQ